MRRFLDEVVIRFRKLSENYFEALKWAFWKRLKALDQANHQVKWGYGNSIGYQYGPIEAVQGYVLLRLIISNPEGNLSNIFPLDYDSGLYRYS